MNYPSKLIESMVTELSKLPGIGKKTALRLSIHLLKETPEASEKLGNAVLNMRRDIQFCQQCYNVSDAALCNICNDPRRDQQTICVVETIREVMAIESTAQYHGVYHVLGGVISPIDGIGPDALHINSLLARVAQLPTCEIIMALNPTMEGDTTIFYLSRQLKNHPQVQITAIARGIAFGGELEYADELTLARSIAKRQPYETYLVQ